MLLYTVTLSVKEKNGSSETNLIASFSNTIMIKLVNDRGEI